MHNKECTVCKQPAVLYARITRKSQTTNEYLCESCAYKVSRYARIDVLDSSASYFPKGYSFGPESTRTQQPQGTSDPVPEAHAKKEPRNTWKAPFIILLVLFLIAESVNLYLFRTLFRNTGNATLLPQTGISANTQNQSQEIEGTTETSIKELSIGESIITENWEITLSRVEFADRISFDGQAKNFLFYADSQWIEEMTEEEGRAKILEEEGHVFVSLMFTVKYLGKTRTSFNPLIDLDYDSGYIYSFGGCYYYNDQYNFPDNPDYFEFDLVSHLFFEPKGKIFEMRTYLSAPIEIKDNVNAPLKVVFRSVDGTDYAYRIR